MSTPSEVLQRVRPLAELPALAERAAVLLSEPKSMVQLTLAEARLVTTRMGLVTYPAGSTLLREGAESVSGHMLLLLEGEVSVDSVGETSAIALSVISQGEIIGEMALLDGAPRSASCHAISAVQAAGLSRRGLEDLMAENPVVAAKLLVVLAARIADRLRAVSQQVHVYAQLAADRSEELNRLKRSSGAG